MASKQELKGNGEKKPSSWRPNGKERVEPRDKVRQDGCALSFAVPPFATQFEEISAAQNILEADRNNLIRPDPRPAPTNQGVSDSPPPQREIPLNQYGRPLGYLYEDPTGPKGPTNEPIGSGNPPLTAPKRPQLSASHAAHQTSNRPSYAATERQQPAAGALADPQAFERSRQDRQQSSTIAAIGGRSWGFPPASLACQSSFPPVPAACAEPAIAGRGHQRQAPMAKVGHQVAGLSLSSEQQRVANAPGSGRHPASTPDPQPRPSENRILRGPLLHSNLPGPPLHLQTPDGSVQYQRSRNWNDPRTNQRVQTYVQTQGNAPPSQQPTPAPVEGPPITGTAPPPVPPGWSNAMVEEAMWLIEHGNVAQALSIIISRRPRLGDLSEGRTRQYLTDLSTWFHSGTR